jgi:N-acetylglucosaminyldiphosphoundecaprenol N-acetyl-beta-D-mannosaminyltransferase
MDLSEVDFSYVAGIKTACLSRSQLVRLFVEHIIEFRRGDRTQPLTVFDTNGHGISMAHQDGQFYSALKHADVIHADGQSVVSFSRWFGNKVIPERSATTDTIHDIPIQYNGEVSHFLLGGTQGVVEGCAAILANTYPNFKIAGTQHGYFSVDEEQAVIDHINRSQADVLWVGLGKPKEQLFVIRNKHKFKIPVIITCGGCYNYITGDYARAPKLMQNMGFEWLHRALTEPRKFLWRYLTTNPHAIYCAIKHRNVRY